VHSLLVPHTVLSVGSESLCPLLNSTLCPLSVRTSQCRLLVLCQYVHCCLLQSVHCLAVTHTVHFVGSVSLCPLLHSTTCKLTVSTSHYTVCFFCVTISNAVLYRLSTVCKYLTLYSLLVLCHYVHSCLLQSVHCRSVLHAVQTVGLVSPCPLQYFTVCPLSVSSSHSTVRLFSVSMSTYIFYSLSEPHTVHSVGSVLLCQLLPCTVCPLSVSTSHHTVCWFWVIMSTAAFYSLSTVYQSFTLYSLLVLCQKSTDVVYSLSTACQYLTLCCLLVLCHYVHC